MHEEWLWVLYQKTNSTVSPTWLHGPLEQRCGLPSWIVLQMTIPRNAYLDKLEHIINAKFYCVNWLTYWLFYGTSTARQMCPAQHAKHPPPLQRQDKFSQITATVIPCLFPSFPVLSLFVALLAAFVYSAVLLSAVGSGALLRYRQKRSVNKNGQKLKMICYCPLTN